MLEEKVYTPEVIEENPYPQDTSELVGSTSSAPKNDTYSPAQVKESTIRRKRQAVELLSTALNTRSKKILQQFELQESGGLKIGNYQEGLTGEVSITPNGILGKNTSGLTTFGLDTDGNLILVGELRSGSVLTGGVVVENEEGTTIIDGGGIVSTSSFLSGSAVKSSSQSLTNDTFTDISDLSVTLTASRDRNVNVLFLVTVTGIYSAEFDGLMIFRFMLDGSTEIGPKFLLPALFDEITQVTTSAQFVYSLPAGEHTIKVQGRANNNPAVGASVSASFANSVLSYVTLGS